jgi:hypothetical protein
MGGGGGGNILITKLLIVLKENGNKVNIAVAKSMENLLYNK